MKYNWVPYFSTSILIGVFCGILFWLLYPFARFEALISSPLPSFLTLANNSQVTSLTLWKPDIKEVYKTNIPQPSVASEAVLVYDLTTNKTLFSKNPTKKLPVASLTKIMTAIIALENKKSDNSYRVYHEDLVGENVMGLTDTEILTLEELLYGLILNSGNDAAEVLAHNYLSGRDEFVTAMNNKAKSLGLSDTNFTNPSGLQGDGDQHSTAYDLLVITRYAIENYPMFNTVASTFRHHIPKTATHKEFFLENETNLLTSYKGVKGVKTGYTPEAGLCLVTYLEYEGHRIIGIILGSNNRRQTMRDLLDYSLKLQNIEPPTL